MDSRGAGDGDDAEHGDHREVASASVSVGVGPSGVEVPRGARAQEQQQEGASLRADGREHGDGGEEETRDAGAADEARGEDARLRHAPRADAIVSVRAALEVARVVHEVRADLDQEVREEEERGVRPVRGAALGGDAERGADEERRDRGGERSRARRREPSERGARRARARLPRRRRRARRRGRRGGGRVAAPGARAHRGVKDAGGREVDEGGPGGRRASAAPRRETSGLKVIGRSDEIPRVRLVERHSCESSDPSARGDDAARSPRSPRVRARGSPGVRAVGARRPAPAPRSALPPALPGCMGLPPSPHHAVRRASPRDPPGPLRVRARRRRSRGDLLAEVLPLRPPRLRDRPGRLLLRGQRGERRAVREPDRPDVGVRRALRRRARVRGAQVLRGFEAPARD